MPGTCPVCLEVNDERPAICDCRGTMAPMHRACVAELVRALPRRELLCGLCRSPLRVNVVRRWCRSTNPRSVALLVVTLLLSIGIDVADMRGTWRPQDSAVMQPAAVLLCLAWREIPGHDGRYVAEAVLVHTLAMLVHSAYADGCIVVACAVVVAIIPVTFLSAARRVAPVAHGVATLATLMLGWGVLRRSAMMVTCYGWILRCMAWVIAYASVWPEVVRTMVV
jgi:hypothetical protein